MLRDHEWVGVSVKVVQRQDAAEVLLVDYLRVVGVKLGQQKALLLSVQLCAELLETNEALGGGH